jgi:hypothetical protein
MSHFTLCLQWQEVWSQQSVLFWGHHVLRSYRMSEKSVTNGKCSLFVCFRITLYNCIKVTSCVRGWWGNLKIWYYYYSAKICGNTVIKPNSFTYFIHFWPAVLINSTPHRYNIMPTMCSHTQWFSVHCSSAGLQYHVSHIKWGGQNSKRLTSKYGELKPLLGSQNLKWQFKTVVALY